MLRALLSEDQKGDYEMLLGSEQIERKPASEGRYRYRKYFRLGLALFFVAVVSCMFYLGRSSSSTSYSDFIASKRVGDWEEMPTHKVRLPHVYIGEQTTNPVNSTLGFQKVIALNLPHRLDKKDELTMMGLASDINIDFLTTRLVKDLQDVGLPHHGPLEYPGVLGCWRAHADAWLQVVTERLSTALIMEDDNDWDVEIKKQLQRVHQPFATLLDSVAEDNKTRISTSADPYLHDDWDLLFLGYCLEKPASEEDHPEDVDPHRPQHVLFDDDTILDRDTMLGGSKEPTVNSIAAWMDYFGYPLPTQEQPSTPRVIARAHNPICTNAYAVSLKGAAKLLYYTTREIPYAVDVQLMSLIGTGKIKAYEVMPPLFGQWKIKDAGNKNSDNFVSANGGKYVEDSHAENHNPSVGHAENVRNSVRSSLQDILVNM